MEGWNDDPPEADQNDINHFNFIVTPAGGGTINPTLHHPKTAIPLFHHSNRTTLSLDSEALGRL
jgi:hypothetical protein